MVGFCVVVLLISYGILTNQPNILDDAQETCSVHNRKCNNLITDYMRKLDVCHKRITYSKISATV